jgi:hypothetical protein
MTGAVAAMGGVAILGFPLTSQTIASNDFSLNSDGTTTEDTGGAGRWIINGAPGNYEVLCTVTSGSLNSGTTGSYLSLGSTQQWVIHGSAATIRLQIRDAFSTSQVLDVTLVLEP